MVAAGARSPLSWQFRSKGSASLFGEKQGAIGVNTRGKTCSLGAPLGATRVTTRRSLRQNMPVLDLTASSVRLLLCDATR